MIRAVQKVMGRRKGRPQLQESQSFPKKFLPRAGYECDGAASTHHLEEPSFTTIAMTVTYGGVNKQ